MKGLMNSQEGYPGQFPPDKDAGHDGVYAYIGGNVSGQVIAGNNNVQVQQVGAQPAVLSEDDLDSLRRQFQALKVRIQQDAPETIRRDALQRAAELEVALLDDGLRKDGLQRKTLTKMEYIRDWFVEQLPAIAGTVGGLVVHPLVGRLVEAGGDALVAEFKRRFA